MENAGNGKVGGLIEALKTILGSPVGGWALAVAAVGWMAYLTFKDRQLMYQDLIHLRQEAMPQIIQGTKIAQDNYELLKEIRSMVRIPSDNRTTMREIRDMLKEWEGNAGKPAGFIEIQQVPTISNDQP